MGKVDLLERGSLSYADSLRKAVRIDFQWQTIDECSPG